MLLSKNAVILFQGDSITDAGRDRTDPAGLGTGYPLMIANALNAAYPDWNLTFYNRGVSGDRTTEMEARWREDCLDIRPDLLSVLIGINDTWRRYDQNSPTSAEEYYKRLCRMLKAARDENPNIRILLIEPFLLHVSEERMSWREDLNPKILYNRQAAIEYADAFVPMDGYFAAACLKRGPSFWAGDGVHPSQAGHALIARKWIEAALAE
ncbi:MAG TPA: SGNH/GDSL hydrolase family protein [Candidatus Merdivicinus intestinavium]|nr:SGNH/GDSL hydrolase family protein [Candidatus Merdivicinus intestinavium]